MRENRGVILDEILDVNRLEIDLRHGLVRDPERRILRLGAVLFDNPGVCIQHISGVLPGGVVSVREVIRQEGVVVVQEEDVLAARRLHAHVAAQRRARTADSLEEGVVVIQHLTRDLQRGGIEDVRHHDEFVIRKRTGPQRTQAAAKEKRPEMRCNDDAEIRALHDRGGQGGRAHRVCLGVARRPNMAGHFGHRK